MLWLVMIVWCGMVLLVLLSVGSVVCYWLYDVEV